jgi:hypothetical protein
MTLNIALTREVVDPILDALVEEYGADYVYPEADNGCLYVRDGAPSCIIGHVYNRLGVPLEVLAANEFTTASEVAHRALGVDIYNNEGGDFIPIARYLDRIQREQDSTIPWGQAVESARTKYKN